MAEKLDLDALERLADAATPSPWIYQEDSDVYTHILRADAAPGTFVVGFPQAHKGRSEADARFTAAARSAVPALVVRVRELERRVSQNDTAYMSDWNEGQRALSVQVAAEPQPCQCPACCGGATHASDCAVHNEPAYPNGECDCGARDPFAWATFDGEGSWDLRLYAGNESYRDEYIARNGVKYSGWVKPLHEAADPQSAVPEGWKLVPSTPTDEMLAAMLSEGEYGVLAHHSTDPIAASAVLRISGVGTRYANMLAAAPSPAKEG